MGKNTERIESMENRLSLLETLMYLSDEQASEDRSHQSQDVLTSTYPFSATMGSGATSGVQSSNWTVTTGETAAKKRAQDRLDDAQDEAIEVLVEMASSDAPARDRLKACDLLLWARNR